MKIAQPKICANGPALRCANVAVTIDSMPFAAERPAVCAR